ncbi:hypothetical protein GCM10022228_13410 [Halomonas cibimaris]|uniref:Restriction endonuclease n=1 Tax=Halomonas cibimaris TaxID=657012 RepID=A0ABP7LNQ6_9GAMM
MENSQLDAIAVIRKSGHEPITECGRPVGKSLLDFWQWSTSDLVGNAMRGVLAEYLVAVAVKGDSGTRTEWDAYDVKTASGVRVEVKSGAYLQTWAQTKLSTIQFNISPSFGWDSKTEKLGTTQVRQADVYVFCILAHKDKSTVDPLNLDQWEFYVLPTEVLNQQLGKQKSIGLRNLLRLHPSCARHHELSDAINVAAHGHH